MKMKSNDEFKFLIYQEPHNYFCRNIKFNKQDRLLSSFLQEGAVQEELIINAPVISFDFHNVCGSLCLHLVPKWYMLVLWLGFFLVFVFWFFFQCYPFVLFPLALFLKQRPSPCKPASVLECAFIDTQTVHFEKKGVNISRRQYMMQCILQIFLE